MCADMIRRGKQPLGWKKLEGVEENVAGCERLQASRHHRTQIRLINEPHCST